MDSGRVVVTGATAYTCCGVGRDAFWGRLGSGLGGNGAPSEAARVFPPLDDSAIASDRRLWSPHRLAAHTLAAIQRDLGEHLASFSAEQRERVGVAMGSAYGNLGAYFDYYETATEQGYQCVNPTHFPLTLPSAPTYEVSKAYSLWGDCATLGCGLSAGLDAIGYAVDAILRGQEGAMLAGGLDELNEYANTILQSSGLLSPSNRIRPFAADRDGTLPGEAVAILLLESAQEAVAAGREALAEIGRVHTARGVDWTSGLPKATETIRQALRSADLEPGDVGAVFPSASGDGSGDEFEMALLGELFAERLPSVHVLPVKAVTGECFAASGPLQCLAAVYAVARAPEAASEAGPASEAPLQLPDTITRQRSVLVYSTGYDGTFAAVAVKSPAA